MRTSMQDILRHAERPFNIIEAFEALGPKYKLVLCECLFMKGPLAFRGMVQIFWPKTAVRDMKRLERFLMVLGKP